MRKAALLLASILVMRIPLSVSAMTRVSAVNPKLSFSGQLQFATYLLQEAKRQTILSLP